MKESSIVRKIDVLCRIVLPCELRNKLKLKRGDEVEIFVSNGTITINKYKRGGGFCRREGTYYL